MNIDKIKGQVRGWVQGIVPETVVRNRGYLPALVPVLVLWGGVVGGLLLLEGRPALAQEIIDFTTYACIGVAALTIPVQGWKETSRRKLGVAFVWSIFGVVSYFLLGVLAVMIMMTGTGMIGLGGEERVMTSMGLGGIATMYGWYRVNWVAFRWVRNRIENEEKSLVGWYMSRLGSENQEAKSE